jgi:alpha-1,3-rhamnosyl/mannosyltransferase
MHIALNASNALKPHTGLGVYCIHVVQALARVDRLNTYDVFVPVRCKAFDSLPDSFRQVVPTGDSGIGWSDLPERTLNLRLDDFDRRFTTTPAFAARRYDLVHALRFTTPRRHRQLPMVYTVHDVIPSLVTPRDVLAGRFPTTMLSVRGVLRRWTEQGPLRRAVHLAVDSEATRQDVMRLYRISPEAMSVVPCGVDEALFAYPGEPTTLDAYGLAPQTYLLYFGGHTARKNVARMCEAYRRLPVAFRRAHPLVITGSGASEQQARRRHGRTEGVVFTGQVPRATLLALVHGAFAALYLSLYEGFGLPLLEAAAMGVPTIASRTSAIPEVLPGAFVPVSPYDVPAIAEAMRLLVASPEARDRLGRQARDVARTRGWDDTARGLCRVYAACGARQAPRWHDASV